MEGQRYCVYNQTSECFLTLEASLASDALGYLGQIFRNQRPKAADEGQWVLQPKPIHSLRMFSSRDLLLLDANYRVLEAIESWPSRRIVRLRDDAASMLSLPVHTIYSSQTQPGHQLVICLPEEMRERLRNLPAPAAGDSEPAPLASASGAAKGSFTSRAGTGWAQRNAEEPKLVAYDSKDTNLRVYSVSEVSATGLVLATDQRWPVGSQLALTLQRMDAVSDSLLPAITVEVCVARWSEGGVGLTFAHPGVLDPLLTEMIGR